MKQYRKELKASGPYRTATAEVVATMNYSTEIVNGKNAFTHNDFVKHVAIHKVELFVNGQLLSDKTNLRSEQDVLSVFARFIKEGREHINDLVNKPPVKSFHDLITELINEPEILKDER